jgi:hypothetical protein
VECGGEAVGGAEMKRRSGLWNEFAPAQHGETASSRRGPNVELSDIPKSPPRSLGIKRRALQRQEIGVQDFLTGSF